MTNLPASSQPATTASSPADLTAPEIDHSFVLQKVQPALLGLMDGSVSTLAPLFAAAGLTHSSHKLFSSASPLLSAPESAWACPKPSPTTAPSPGAATRSTRGLITRLGDHSGRHAPHAAVPARHRSGVALHIAYGVVVVELLAIAYIRYHFMKTPLAQTVGQVIVGGGIVFAIGVWLGKLGAG